MTSLEEVYADLIRDAKEKKIYEKKNTFESPQTLIITTRKTFKGSTSGVFKGEPTRGSPACAVLLG